MNDIEGGILDAREEAKGQWRWEYTMPHGAWHYGPKLYPTKSAAKRAGRAWIKESVEIHQAHGI